MENENKIKEECNCSENNSCIFPKCPNCRKGYLLPFSYKEDVFEKWKCSNPECSFVLQKR